jgi:hypothetical protein
MRERGLSPKSLSRPGRRGATTNAAGRRSQKPCVRRRIRQPAVPADPAAAENYDIPCPYAPAPPALAAELLRSYDTAATATRRAAVALDKLAVTTGSPSSTLAVARLSADSPVTARQPAGDDRGQTQAQPAPPPDLHFPGAGCPRPGQPDRAPRLRRQRRRLLDQLRHLRDAATAQHQGDSHCRHSS